MPGDPPRPGSRFCSPFRPDRNPSCDISKCGKWFADRSRGDNLDPVAFVRCALDADWPEVRLWFMERMGLDHPPSGKAAPRPVAPKPREIAWPGELVEGTPETWEAFAAKRRLAYPAVFSAVQCGMLRFLKLRGVRCFALTDPARRSAEIRRCDGATFENGRKQYPLPGISKAWPIGAGLLSEFPSKSRSILLCEGASDMLAAWGAFVSYRRAEPKNPARRDWVPVGLLGASCKHLDPELVPWFRGRTVRLAPDGDEAGDGMAEHWRELLLEIGCTVEVLKLPRGRDLRDVLESGELKPEELFA